MSTSHHTLFVYGTLMLGGSRNPSFLDGRLFLGGGSTPGRLVDDGGLPGLMRGGSERVFGELYAVSDEDLVRIDAEEGAAYARARVTVRPGNDGPPVAAWAYLLAEGHGGETIAGGRWAGNGGAWPGGTLWYFAYASNLWRMAERRKLDVIERHRARVDNYLIASVTDSGDGKNAYGHILPRRGGTVEGVIYRLHEQQVSTDFDVQEKVGIRMQRRTFAVETDAGRRLWAEVYVALAEKMVWGRPQHPDNAVKILDGARESALPPEYVEFLERLLRKPAEPSDYDAP